MVSVEKRSSSVRQKGGDGVSKGSQPDAKVLFDRAWPDGVPAEELKNFARLSPERAEVVLARLQALLDLEDHGTSPGVALGIGRTAAFTLRRRWTKHRSIAAITPYQSDVAKKTIRHGGTDVVASIVRDVVDQSPYFVSDGDCAREVVRRAVDKITYEPALVLVRARRTLVAARPDVLRAHYGRTIIVDCSAVDIPLTRTDFAPAVVALVMEKTSRLILGAATGMSSNTLVLQQATLVEAMRFLENSPLDRRDAPNGTSVELTVGTSPAGRDLEVGDRLSTTPNVDFNLGGPHRSGARANALLNGRLGGLRLLPRATFLGRMGGVAIRHAREPVELGAADALVLEAVSRHNSLIVPNLHDNLRSDLVVEGSMHSSMRQLLSEMD